MTKNPEEETTALAPLARSPIEGAVADGVAALAQMPEAEFEQRLAAMRDGQVRVARIKKELMVDGVHYGNVPGTDKAALFKPGAEALCQMYGLRAAFEPDITYGDGVTAPAVRVVVRCELHLREIGGPIIAIGFGAASTWERKHRYRNEGRACPACGVVGKVIKGKSEYGGGWLCWKKEGGCGAKFTDNDPAITGQVVGMGENPDQADLENTVLKMAEKRAYVDATLRGTASSDLFTQDIEQAGKGNRPPPASEHPPMQQPQPTGGGPAPATGGATIANLEDAKALFAGDDVVTGNQVGRLETWPARRGWDATMIDEHMQAKLSITAAQIPSLGDGYEAVVVWFQNNPPGAA